MGGAWRMTDFRCRAALAALVVLLIGWPGRSGAQSARDGQKASNMVGNHAAGVSRSDSTDKVLTTDANGYLYTTPGSPERDNVRLIQNVIQNSGLANGS